MISYEQGIIRFASKGDREIVLKTLNYSENDKTENGNANGAEKSNGHTNGAEKLNEETKTEETTVEETKAEETTAEETKAEEETKTEETKAEDAQAIENMDSAKTDAEPENVKTSTDYKMLKLNDNLILKYNLVEGDEERAYWQKIKKLSLGSNQKKHNQHKKKRFGGFNKYNKNKRSANEDRDTNKKAKVDA